MLIFRLCIEQPVEGIYTKSEWAKRKLNNIVYVQATDSAERKRREKLASSIGIGNLMPFANTGASSSQQVYPNER